MKKNRGLVFIILALVVIVAIVGVVVAKSDKSTTSTMSMSASSATATNAVSIKNYMFGPMAIKVKVGTKVTWTNTDSVKHTITADNGSMPKSQLIGQGETYSYTFTKAGTYSYHCEPHPYMHGTVVVTN